MKSLVKKFPLPTYTGASRAVGGSPCLRGAIQQCVWSGVFSYRGQFSMPVKAGANGLWLDLVQEVLVAEGGHGQVLLALPSWELLSVSSAIARGLCIVTQCSFGGKPGICAV